MRQLASGRRGLLRRVRNAACFGYAAAKPKVQVKKSWIAIGAAVLVVALVVVLCVTLIGGNSAKGVLEKYLDGVTGFDGAAIWENASVRVHGCDTKEECVAEQKEMKTQMESYSSMLADEDHL